MKVFLVGPMGTGKSTTGRNLSEKLDYDFYDTDKLIEKAEGKKIKDIFEQMVKIIFVKKNQKLWMKLKPSKMWLLLLGEA